MLRVQGLGLKVCGLRFKPLDLQIRVQEIPIGPEVPSLEP